MSKKNRKKATAFTGAPAPAALNAPGPELREHVRLRALVFWSVFLFLTALSFYLRATHLDLRPFHNDEGVNWFFIDGMKRTGYYPYSHENYHGPLFFYLLRALTMLFGDAPWAVRSAAVLPGMLTLLLPLLLRKREGDLFTLLAVALIGFSSSNVFYSRYAIHEPLFSLAGATLALALFRWRYDEKAAWWYLAWLGVTMLITTKETFIITLACLFLAIASLGAWKSTLVRLYAQRATILYGAIFCVVLTMFTFSGGFQWAGGLREALLAVPQWVGRNESDVGHHKAFVYYFRVILDTEPQLLLGALFSLAALITWLLGWIVGRRKLLSSLLATNDFRFICFSSVWFIISFLVYSYVKYKTPWLIINITLPGTFVLAWWLTRLYEHHPWNGQLSALIAFPVLIGIALYTTNYYNFTLPYGDGNPFSYVHTTKGMLDAVADIEHYWQKHPTAKVLVAVDGYWPFPYYVRNKPGQVNYVKSDEVQRYSATYEVMLMEREVVWDDPHWARKYYRLSDVEETNIYFKRSE